MRFQIDESMAVLRPQEILEIEQEMARNIYELTVNDPAIELLCLLEGGHRITNGVFRELIKSAGKPVVIHHAKATSYDGMKSTGNVEIHGNLPSYSGRIFVIEDVIETGLTLSEVERQLRDRGNKEVYKFTLIDKPECRKVQLEADYSGKTVGPDDFVVGYGIDADGWGRDFNSVYTATAVESDYFIESPLPSNINLLAASAVTDSE